MSLASQINLLATRAAQEIKAVREAIGFTFVQTTTPTPTQEGQTWLDPTWTIAYYARLYVDGLGGTSLVWEQFNINTTGFTFTQEATPTATFAGQTWYDTSTGLSYVWFDSYWVQTSPGGGGGGGVDLIADFTSSSSAALAFGDQDVPSLGGSVQFVQGETYRIDMIVGIQAPTAAGNSIAIDGWPTIGATALLKRVNALTATSTVAGTSRVSHFEHSWLYMHAATTAALTVKASVTVNTSSLPGAAFFGGAAGFDGHRLSITKLNSGNGPGGLTYTPWTALPLASGWVDFGGGNQPAQYRKVGDDVQLRGLVKRTSTSVAAGVASDIGNLPAGFRAPTHLIHTVISKPSASVALQGVLIQQLVTGAVQYYAETTGAGLGTDGWVTLTGINFSVTP